MAIESDQIKTGVVGAGGSPTGTVSALAGASIPTDYLLCDGAAISRTTYADLFTAIGTAHGDGDGSTTFNLPDYRGRFLRGTDGGAGNDPDSGSRTASGSNGNTGDALGSYQADANKSHRHISGVPTDNGRNVYGQANVGNRASLSYNGVVSPYSPYTNYEGASDSRPKNINVNYIIKY